MVAGEIVQLWTDAGIQIVVLFSFTFQVFLFFFAGIRRRNASPLLTALLWLVYLLADSAAVYALGHMSCTNLSGKHQLVAFWAPLLLVHLGGPDSITAYAIADSRLWLRHLLTLVVQTLGTVYVLHKYVAGASSTGRLLRVASVCMFTVGVLKYSERIWALRCGSMAGIKSRRKLVKYADNNPSFGETVRISFLKQKVDNEEELLILAHLLLRQTMDHFAGAQIWTGRNTSDVYGLHEDDIYKLVQMQLSLMYDIMYTKAWVIHTLEGYNIRAFSLVGTIASMLFFAFSNKNGYSKFDVNITYFLLAGAMVLEIISVLATVGSTWMCAGLSRFKMAYKLVTLQNIIRRYVRAANKRRWSSSIGQYNLFHFCTHDCNELGSTAARKMGLDKWWTRVHFVCTADISKTYLLGLLLKTLPKLDPEHSRGIQILENSGLGKEQAGWSHWSLNLDFLQSIIIWHLATDVYLIRSREARCQEDLANAVKILSNYMMYLLVAKPDMLPGYIEETLYDDTCTRLDLTWSKACKRQGNTESPKKWWDMLKKLFHNDGPNGSRITQIEQFVSAFHSKFLRDHEGKWEYAPPAGRKVGSNTSYLGANVHAKEHAAELLHLESSRSDLLEVIFGVWLEMLFYAAQRCGPESHASELSGGSEFITVVWLLTQHFEFPCRQSQRY